ncbi:MAG: phosphoglucosamine mutase [Verrucomicrobia bacterium CG_4_10_14_3_um_filter_43_23]|nr:MAG: phosphoglucosamine mutase [Verrucomicrobia bacterium CG22_combo_CG10-13_8_21_14_all_43_17]PIX59060.1 MAG: phosphoglucosamine mutase [Verrucomicrobia bacterium CG_4_10_14_3_um_filter_43_23]PIY62549.1 MAG: phosphoglucosamine mutase [Verrucomicrobia bacterium CG_4_10_14_0_8_um_filter_43_34]PJA44631.1 MAG: phosphoglucosamine mutase [Verrucomicrobia bacterium CG_4_9_14_3_um_filter_43_20]
MNLDYFGTDGIRGRYGSTFFTEAFVKKLGVAIKHFVKERSEGEKVKVIIGRDTRASGQAIENHFIYGLAGDGVEIVRLGVLPTPGVSLLVDGLDADMGVMITASHNPASDNGLKFFNKSGMKLSREEERAIEERLGAIEVPVISGDGEIQSLDGADLYAKTFLSLFSSTYFHNLKIVVDAANGAMAGISPEVMRSFGAEVIAIGDQPDGNNINDCVGSEFPQHCRSAVMEHSADIGIAHDGDGDRLLICDEHGDVVPGEVVMGVISKYLIDMESPGSKTLVTTVQSNLGLDKAIRKAGGRVARVDVGDRNVAYKMLELKADFGGESSGHLIFFGHCMSGDSLFAALMFMSIMRDKRKSVSQLACEIPLFPHKAAAVVVAEKKPLETLEALNQARAKWENFFGQEGRLLIRYSGTEPKLRLLVEGQDEQSVNQAMQSLLDAIQSDFNL